MKLILAHHTIDEWCDKRGEQARKLGCSETYITRLRAELRERFNYEVKEVEDGEYTNIRRRRTWLRLP